MGLDLDGWLERRGLSRAERVLLAAMASIAAADWQLLAHCIHAGRRERLERRLLEETLLQAVLFFGFPRAVTAFGELDREWPRAGTADNEALPAEQQPTAGRALFDRIYGDRSAAVRAMLRSHHPELHDFVLTAAYGRILTRPGLTSRQRELLAVTALQATDQVPQLIAHARGALHCGADEHEVREAMLGGGAPPHLADAHLHRISKPGARTEPGSDSSPGDAG